MKNTIMSSVEERLKKLEDMNYIKTQKKIIMKTCKYVYLEPQRQVKLSWDEEKERLHSTWKSWGRKLWQAVQKSKSIIGDIAIDPERFAEQVDAGDLVLGFSDQVPWWGYVQTKKQM